MMKGRRTQKPGRKRSQRTSQKTPRKTSQKTLKKTASRAKGRSAASVGGGWRLAFLMVKWGVITLVWGGIIMGGVVAWFLFDLPPLDPLSSATRQPSIVVLDRHGAEIAVVGGRHGRSAQVSELPPHLIAAFLAVEDRRFRSHFGLDPVGLARAAWANFKAGRVVQGGSTITQQLAKTLFLTPERSLKRKIQEAALSLWLESKYSKDQILAIYLNRIYFGTGAYGIEAAAQTYFGKSARNVNLYESALLAGLPKAPSRYAPSRDPALAHRRAQVVMAAMRAVGFLREDQWQKLRKQEIPKGLKRSGPPRSARYFTDWILPRARAIVGNRGQDIIVRTTLDLGLQAHGEAVLGAGLAASGQPRQVEQAALVSMTSDGAIRAMIGGRDYGDSQYNRVTQARRQPGSAFKLFVYLAALEAGFTPEQMMMDQPVEIDGWSPANYSGIYSGAMTLAQALAQSVNSIAVQLTETVGRDQVIAVARRLGITGPLPDGPALALGVGEVNLLDLCSAYAVFNNDGRGVWPYGIEDIRTGEGNVLYHRQGSGPGRVVAPDQVARLRSMLAQVVKTGTGRAALLVRPVAGKTGTSQNFRDAWFIGFDEALITGVWLGNDDARPMNKVTGGGLPARLWRDFMALPQ